MKTNTVKIVLIVILFAIILGGILTISFTKIIEESAKPGNLSQNCIKILNEIKNSNPEELGDLYDDIIIRKMDPSLVFTACDYGPEEGLRACMEREKIYYDKLVCMQNLLNDSRISKEQLMKIENFE